MAARGGRSRKVVQLEIQKQATKHPDKLRSSPSSLGYSAKVETARITSPISGWGWTRKTSLHSADEANYNTSNVVVADTAFSAAAITTTTTTTTVNPTPAPSALSAARQHVLVDYNSDSLPPLSKQKSKSHSNMNTAVRGRGGGASLPLKLSPAAQDRLNLRSSRGVKDSRRQSYATILPNSEAAVSSPVSSTWENTRIWRGGLNLPRPFKGFDQDDDMWMSDGNCLIFFAEETQEADPVPMCRVHSEVLEQSRSIFMINLLRYGEVSGDEDQFSHHQHQYNQNPPWTSADRFLSGLDGQAPTDSVSLDSSNPLYQFPHSMGSDSNSHSTPISIPGDITHEIWFRAPSHISRPDVQRRHHMATRNFLALLYGLPLVGNEFYEMLSDLQHVMDTYYELNDPSERWNSAQVIIKYLLQHALDDVRGNPSHALGLMAWAEQPSVRWEAGFMEGFVHASGMMSKQTPETPEFRALSQVARHKLQNSFNSLELKLMEAEDRLKAFDFPELWYAEGVEASHPAQKAYEEFRDFLQNYYKNMYGSWPPEDLDHTEHWLSRVVVDRLQKDMGALYDYIVDRDVEWDVRERRGYRKYEMVSKTGYSGDDVFKADQPGLPINSMIVGFDTTMRYEHIPHPYPLLPARFKGKPQKKKLLSKITNKKTPMHADPKEQFQVSLAFTGATNKDGIGQDFKENPILDSFQHHEKCYSPVVFPPADARTGRWVLLYAVLQVLSTLSVDVSGLKYSSKIRYFACPSLNGLPPWNSRPVSSSSGKDSISSSFMREATQKLSYCWLAVSRWNAADNSSPQHSAAMTPVPPAYETHVQPLTASDYGHPLAAHYSHPANLVGNQAMNSPLGLGLDGNRTQSPFLSGSVGRPFSPPAFSRMIHPTTSLNSSSSHNSPHALEYLRQFEQSPSTSTGSPYPIPSYHTGDLSNDGTSQYHTVHHNEATFTSSNSAPKLIHVIPQKPSLNLVAKLPLTPDISMESSSPSPLTPLITSPNISFAPSASNPLASHPISVSPISPVSSVSSIASANQSTFLPSPPVSPPRTRQSLQPIPYHHRIPPGSGGSSSKSHHSTNPFNPVLLPAISKHAHMDIPDLAPTPPPKYPMPTSQPIVATAVPIRRPTTGPSVTTVSPSASPRRNPYNGSPGSSHGSPGSPGYNTMGGKAGSVSSLGSVMNGQISGSSGAGFGKNALDDEDSNSEYVVSGSVVPGRIVVQREVSVKSSLVRNQTKQPSRPTQYL